jgi:hypothetical protein
MKRQAVALAAWVWIAAFGGSSALAAVCTDPGGIGGTGVRADGGIGGTGARAEGGIGGTGIRADADLGLVGVITGFASICVNGVEVHYEAATPVTVNGEAASTQALALGQTVTVRALGSAVEARAHSISVLDAAAGPVTDFDPRSNTARVLGQRVRFLPSTVLGPGLARDAPAGAGAGETLRVSGLRTADGTIVATRVERAPAGTALLHGPLVRDAAGATRIGGLAIDARGRALEQLAAADGAVLVAGRVQDGKFVVERVLAAPLATALASPRFVVQAYVAEVRAGGELRAGGLAFKVDAKLEAQLAPDRLVRVSGRTNADGRRVVERIDFLAEPLNPRPRGAADSGGPRSRGADDRRGRGDGSGDDDRGGSGDGGGDSSGRSDRSGSSGSDRTDRGDNSGPSRPERIDRPDSRGRR